jgi:hypothetical protein
VTLYHDFEVTELAVVQGRPEAFEKLLLDLGFTKGQFAGIWGVSRETVSRWQDRVPRGVLRYLKLLRDLKNFTDSDLPRLSQRLQKIAILP